MSDADLHADHLDDQREARAYVANLTRYYRLCVETCDWLGQVQCWERIGHDPGLEERFHAVHRAILGDFEK